MKKINVKSVLKTAALSPVYAAGFVYGCGKFIANKMNRKNENPVSNAITDKDSQNQDNLQQVIDAVAEYTSNSNPTVQDSVVLAQTVGVPETEIIHNNEELDAFLNGKED